MALAASPITLISDSVSDSNCGLARMAIVLAVGSNCKRRLSRLGAASVYDAVTPVILPPGRLRLATKPSLTGSPAMPKRIGMLEVAFLAAGSDRLPANATITETPLLTRPAASADN